MAKKKVKKLLIVSYPFPPLPYSGTYRIVRMCKGLVKLGIEVHVVTINIDPRIPNDYALLSKVPLSVKIHRTRIIDPWLSYQGWLKKRRNNNTRSYTNRLISLLMRLITIPDHQIFWIPFAVRKSLTVIKQYGIKNVLITSPPVSSLLTGTLLGKLANINLIADLRDPIVGNVAQVSLLNPKDVISKLEKKLLESIERHVLRRFNTIITNTETQREELCLKYPRADISCVHNCFDEDDYRDVPKQKYDKFTIAHVGSIYGLRKPDILFAAIKKLEQTISPKILNLEVVFVGLNDLQLTDKIERYGLQDYVRLQGLVPHSKAIEIMARSHLLLLIKALSKDGLGQIPAKFFEYLGTGNRIIYIGPENSEVADIIQEMGCGICASTVDSLYFFLKQEYNNFINKVSFDMNIYDTKRYSCNSMVRRVGELLF